MSYYFIYGWSSIMKKNIDYIRYTLKVNWINLSHLIKQSNLIRSKIQNRREFCKISHVLLIDSTFSSLKVFIFKYLHLIYFIKNHCSK